MRAMLDANVCIRVLRDRSEAIRPRFLAEARSLAVSTIVLYELLYGAMRSARPAEQRRLVEEFAAHIAVIPFDAGAADHAAAIKAELSRSGQLIGPNDLLIAGHARSRDLTLITGNLREFTRVQGLRCEDWEDKAAS